MMCHVRKHELAARSVTSVSGIDPTYMAEGEGFGLRNIGPINDLA